MKCFNYKTIAIAGLLASASAFAGSETGNGGNTRQSSVSDIANVIKDLRGSLYVVFSQLQLRPEFWSSDATLTRVMTRLYQPYSTVFGDLDSKIVLQDECVLPASMTKQRVSAREVDGRKFWGYRVGERCQTG